MNNYSVFCDYCSFKKIIKKPEDLQGFKIVPSSPVQKSLPQIDPITNKFKEPTDLELPKKVKCPKCGFAIRPKKQEKKDEQASNADGHQTSS